MNSRTRIANTNAEHDLQTRITNRIANTNACMQMDIVQFAESPATISDDMPMTKAFARNLSAADYARVETYAGLCNGVTDQIDAGKHCAAKIREGES